MNLTEALTQYKNYTLGLIYTLEKEEYDSIEGLLNNRQYIIETIDKIEHSSEEFREIVEDLQILILQKKLNDLMIKERNKVKIELEKFSKNKNANKNYNKKYYVDSLFFNKKI